MAAPAPTVEELLPQIQALQNQVNLLAASVPAAPAAPAVGNASVVFADMPNTQEAEEIIN